MLSRFQPPSISSTAPEQKQPDRRRRWIPLVWVCAVVFAFVLGLGTGGGSPEENAAEVARLADERAELVDAQEDLASAETGVAEREAAVVQAEEALAARESTVVTAEAAVTQREAAAGTVEAALAGREAAVAALEAAKPDTTSAGPAAPPADTTTSAHYENCDAARAAGAAPLHRGEAGYRSGLDRDNDGVACE